MGYGSKNQDKVVLEVLETCLKEGKLLNIIFFGITSPKSPKVRENSGIPASKKQTGPFCLKIFPISA